MPISFNKKSNRREFVKTSSLATAGTLLVPSIAVIYHLIEYQPRYLRKGCGLGTQRAKAQLIVQNTIHAVQSCGKIYPGPSFLPIVTADHK